MPVYNLRFEQEYRIIERLKKVKLYFDCHNAKNENDDVIEWIDEIIDRIIEKIIEPLKSYGCVLINHKDVEFII